MKYVAILHPPSKIKVYNRTKYMLFLRLSEQLACMIVRSMRKDKIYLVQPVKSSTFMLTMIVI